MQRITSGGFSSRDQLTQQLIAALRLHVFTDERYLRVDTGIEHRFGDDAERIHTLLYNSMGPTSDLLRYFPDALLLDKTVRLPTWEHTSAEPEKLASPGGAETSGLFSFFVEYKYTATQRKSSVEGVPPRYVGQIEREAWLTYHRLTSPNPGLRTYLDGKRTRITLIYAAPFAPGRIFGVWEEHVQPIFVRKDVASPLRRSVSTAGSGTPWVNFDIRTLKPLERFLAEDLFWEEGRANQAALNARLQLFDDEIPF